MTKNLEQILTKKEFSSVKNFLKKTVLNDIDPKTTYLGFHVEDLVKNFDNTKREKDIMAVYGLLLGYEETANKTVRSAIRKLREYFHPGCARVCNSLMEAFELELIERGLVPYEINTPRRYKKKNK